MKKKQFIVEYKNTTNTFNNFFLRSLYTPIIGVAAVFLYELLLDFHVVDVNGGTYRDWKIVALTLDLSQDKLNAERNKLEAIGLLRVFEKNDGNSLLFRLNDPLSPELFRNNSLLFKAFCQKQGEEVFEKILFSTKAREYNKEGFAETTVKYQNVFSVNSIQSINNTQTIPLPSCKNLEEAKTGLTAEQFAYYLVNKRASPLQVNTINKIRGMGFASCSINEILYYSFKVNDSKIISSHILTIAKDLFTKQIFSFEKIQVELKNALQNRIKPSESNNEVTESNILTSHEDWDDIFNILGGN